MVRVTVIITAGGIGKRMGGTLPKQFLLLGGKPLLMHTLERCHKALPDAEFILTLPEDWRDHWAALLDKHSCSIEHTIVSGGEERFHSVRNAVKMAQGDYVFIHDGVRPLVSTDTIKRCFEAVKVHGSVVPVLTLKDSLRYISGDGSKAVNRSDYRLVQTPQCFRKEILSVAFDRSYHPGITDDATLVEEAGFPIFLVDGNEENIKITTPSDLMMAEIHLKTLVK